MYLSSARHQHIPALIESAMLDVGMIIFTLLALALSRMGKRSHSERILIVVCALGSAGMGYAAADTMTSYARRSVTNPHTTSGTAS